MTDPLWLLVTARPKEAEKVARACREAGMTHRLIVQPDLDRLGITHWMNHHFAENPEASHYGWLADDTYPITKRWDIKLTEAAGPFGLAYGADDYLDRFASAELRDGAILSSGLCWGGELVRAAGWWALPGLRGAYVDVVWCQVIQELGLARYTPEVLVEHRHWRNDRRDRDALDNAALDDIELTRDVFEAWNLNETLEAIRQAMAKRGFRWAPPPRRSGLTVREVILRLVEAGPWRSEEERREAIEVMRLTLQATL